MSTAWQEASTEWQVANETHSSWNNTATVSGESEGIMSPGIYLNDISSAWANEPSQGLSVDLNEGLGLAAYGHSQYGVDDEDDDEGLSSPQQTRRKFGKPCLRPDTPPLDVKETTTTHRTIPAPMRTSSLQTPPATPNLQQVQNNATMNLLIDTAPVLVESESDSRRKWDKEELEAFKSMVQLQDPLKLQLVSKVQYIQETLQALVSKVHKSKQAHDQQLAHNELLLVYINNTLSHSGSKFSPPRLSK